MNIRTAFQDLLCSVDRRVKLLGIGFVLMSLAAPVGPVYGSGTLTTRGIGMGTAQVAVATGLDAVGVNPANLGMLHSGAFEFRVFDVGLVLENSTVSLGFYNRYNGDSLDAQEKQDILDRIPDGGLKAGGQGDFQLFGVRLGGFAFSLSASASLAATMPKDIFRILLQGIEVGETYKLAPTGSAIGYAKSSISYGRQVPLMYFDEFAVGGTFNYISGIGVAEVVRSTSEVTVDYQSEVRSEFVGRTGLGGNGFSFDLGVSGRTGKIRFGGALLSVVSNISWKERTEEAFLRFVGDSINVYALADLDPDEIFERQDTTYSIPSFSTALPPELLLGVSTKWRGFLLAADYHQALSKRFGKSTTPELAVGVERRVLAVIPLRLGLALGGGRGFRPSFGFGLHLAAFRWDFAVAGVGGLLPIQQRGVYLGTSMRLVF